MATYSVTNKYLIDDFVVLQLRRGEKLKDGEVVYEVLVGDAVGSHERMLRF
jgi:hypothetical protein